MSSLSLPVTRPIGKALVVGQCAARPAVVGTLESLGFTCEEADDPYAAVLELCRRPTGYRALVLNLSTTFKEELAVVATVKGRFPQVEVWLTHVDGRASSLAEAMRLGADGLLGDDGLHRLAATVETKPAVSDPIDDPVESVNEPVLTAEELRALLHESPIGRHE